MAGVRDIRRRIRAVKNMQQITKAMKMVAASKLRKAQDKVIAARPYASQLQEVLARLAQAQVDVSHPLLERRPVENVGYVVFTSDRGLCGGFNANLIRKANGQIREMKDPVKLVTVGRKGRDFFRRGTTEILAEFTGLGDSPNYNQARQIAQEIVRLYEEKVFDEVYLLYTEFISVINQKPSMMKLLPLEQPESKGGRQYIFEPSPAEIMERMLPKYVETLIFRVLLESKACEMGAKMTAMDSATNNAKDMIDRLTLAMNRARQAAITKEISEIVGGAAALE